MERHILPALADLLQLADVLSLVIGDAVLVAGLVFINLGLLLPGLLSTLDGQPANPRGGYQEFGPAAAPTISDPSPRLLYLGATYLQPHTRPHLWRYLSGCGGSSLPASLTHPPLPALWTRTSGDPR